SLGREPKDRVRKRDQSPRSGRQPNYVANIKDKGYHPLRGFNRHFRYLTWGSRPRPGPQPSISAGVEVFMPTSAPRTESSVDSLSMLLPLKDFPPKARCPARYPGPGIRCRSVILTIPIRFRRHGLSAVPAPHL